MLKIKKVVTLAIAVVFIAGSFSKSVLAADNSAKINTIINNGVLSSQKATLVGDDGTKYLVNVYESINNLSSANFSSDTETFVQEYAVRLSKDNMILASSGSQDTTGWDDVGDVEGNIKIYYSKDGNKYKITRVTGSWLIHQSGTAIKNKKVMVVCNEGFFTDQRIDKNISTASFDISTGFTRYADSTQGLVGIGAKSICTVYRTSSGSSWTFEIDNMIAGSIPSIS